MAQNRTMEALVEPLQESNETRLNDGLAVKSQGKRLFSGEFARAMAQKSKEVREQRKREAEQAKAIVGQLQAAAIVEPSQAYRLNRLALVRSQLAKADSELTELLDDPKADQSRLKAILDAVKVLSEQERKLDNRADPGSYRPRTPSTKQSSTGVAPIDE